MLPMSQMGRRASLLPPSLAPRSLAAALGEAALADDLEQVLALE